MVALSRVFGHHFFDDGQESFRNIAAESSNGLRLAGLVPDQFLGHRSLAERRVAREQIIKRGAQAVDIGADIDAVAVQCLFRGEVIGGAQDALVVLLGENIFFIVEKTGQAHVQDLDRPVTIHEEIPRLDVAMDESRLVGMLKADRGLADVMRRP